MKLKINTCIKKLYIQYISCFIFPERIEPKIKGDYVLVLLVPFLVSAPKTIPCRKKQFHSLNASENFLTENEKKDNGIFLLWLS